MCLYMNNCLDDLLSLSRNMGVASGKWEENEQTRPETVSRQIAFITNMADKHDCRLTFDKSFPDEECGETITPEDFWNLNITWDNHVSADRISFAMYLELESFLRHKLCSELSG